MMLQQYATGEPARRSAAERVLDSRARTSAAVNPSHRGSDHEPVAAKATAQPWGLEYARKDNITHLNIYSRGVSRVGRLLSHFTYSPFVHPQYGPFNSMEGFWYYLKAADGCRGLDQMRVLSGRDAKRQGKMLPIQRRARFKAAIIEANFHKVMQNAELKALLLESTLPFDHYYLFEPQVPDGQELPPPVFIRPPGFGWLVEGFEGIRQELKTAHEEDRSPTWEHVPAEAHLS